MSKVLPVIIGSDGGAYSIARTFHEAYGVKSLVISKLSTWHTSYSKIIDHIILPVINEETLMKTLLEIGKKDKKTPKILFGCAEWYTALIIKNKEELEKYFIVPYVNEEIFNKIILKDNFYSICEEIGIKYPKSVVVTKVNYKNVEVPFKYPVVLKPSNNDMYNYANFPGKMKIFIIKNYKDLIYNLENIYNSSYTDTFVIQEFIPGNDSNMRVLTCYCTKDSEVVFSALGHVLLEENTPGSIGNYAAIINTKEDFDIILESAKKFLKKVKYVGFANFDIKKNEKTGEYNFFEINVRLGRSNYYVTGAGFNYSTLLVDEYIENKKDFENITLEESLYHIVPFKVLKKYIKNKKIILKAKELKKNKKSFIPTYYKKDMNLKRYFYNKLALINQVKKYKQFYDK